MKRVFTVAAIFASGLFAGLCLREGSPTALAGVEKCAAKNGDVNADGTVDLSDAVTILGNLFLGNPTVLVPLCAPAPAATGLPDTGQNVCYDFNTSKQRYDDVPCDQATCKGQDAQYATGCLSEGRFTDNGDGTVTDHCTGLMWKKDTADVNGDGQLTDQDFTMWCDALAYCENLDFAGHGDWRLPNIRELLSIVDFGRFNPSINPVFRAFSGGYWSSTSFADAPAGAWDVNFGGGYVLYGDKVNTGIYVRPVRSGP